MKLVSSNYWNLESNILPYVIEAMLQPPVRTLITRIIYVAE